MPDACLLRSERSEWSNLQFVFQLYAAANHSPSMNECLSKSYVANRYILSYTVCLTINTLTPTHIPLLLITAYFIQYPSPSIDTERLYTLLLIITLCYTILSLLINTERLYMLLLITTLRNTVPHPSAHQPLHLLTTQRRLRGWSLLPCWPRFRRAGPPRLR